MAAEVLVIGAGVVGISIALALQQRGHKVMLIDRCQPGRETSFGNAGIIQREAVRPYPFPRDVATLVRMVSGRSNEAHYHWAGLLRLMPQLFQYWHASRPNNHARVIQSYSQLISRCQSEHKVWLDAAQAHDLVHETGWLQLFRSARRFDSAACQSVETCRDHGVNARILSPIEVAAAVPCLRQAETRFSGAIHWGDAWTVRDPGELVGRYAALFQQQGGSFLQADATTLYSTANGWAVRTDARIIEAEHAVLATGPWSGTFCRMLGYRFPLFVKRGYHQHFELQEIPGMPMLDAERGIMMAPMKRGLRILTGAEFASPTARPTPVQLRRGVDYAREWLELGPALQSEPWLGLRPCTVDMLPVVGAAPRHPRLWFNFGHAHHGFTLGPVTGRIVAELIDGDRPCVDHRPFEAARFL